MVKSIMRCDDLALLNQIDLHADAFERQLQLGANPRIEEFLADVTESLREAMLKHLLLLEFEYRSKRRESIDVDEFRRRFPAAAQLIAGMIETVASKTPLLDSVTDGPAPVLPRRLGRFELMELIGRGACGEVFRAIDTALDREVAIKIPRDRIVASPGQLERFVREARNAAQLNHPGIVSVLDVGMIGPTPFIVSEYVGGPSLADLPASLKSVSYETIALFMAEVAEALESAHSHRIIHRDLKPSNLLLAPRGQGTKKSASTLTGYRPRIADFGLARRIDSESLLTADGDVLGTPAYMSPEQARGNANTADARSDVFSLGVIFYELLCGHRPFSGSTSEILYQLTSDSAPPLRKRKRGIPVTLATICERCLRLDPATRYRTAGDIAADLRRWLAGMPILAKRVSLWERSRLLIIRHKRVGLATAAASFAFLILAAILAIRSVQLDSARVATAAEVIEEVKTAPTDRVAAVLQRLAAFPNAQIHIRNALADKGLSQNQRSRLLLAMLPYDATILPELGRLLPQLNAREYLVVAEALAPHGQAITAIMLQGLKPNGSQSATALLKSVCFLRRVAPRQPIEPISVDQLVSTLLRVANEDVESWVRIAKPLDVIILPQLRNRCHGDPSPDIRHLACELIAGMRKDDVRELVSLLTDANSDQVRIISAALKDHSVLARRVLIERQTDVQQQAVHDSGSEIHSKTLANIALTLARLNDDDSIALILSASPDPRCREYFIHRAAASGVPPGSLLNRLRAERNGDVQYALVVAIAEYGQGNIDEDCRRQAVEWLQSAYRTHPHSGVHCAAGWLLRHWGGADQVKALDKLLITEGRVEGRNWFVNSLGITMVVVRGPSRFVMGASPSEESMNLYENQHLHHIPWSFAISATEITSDQFTGYLPGFMPNRNSAPSGDCPVAGVSWHDALSFCRWLSEREHMGQSDSDSARPMKNGDFEVNCDRYGYRLPTSAEWECACRAGTTTSRFCGERATPYLSSYAWWSDHDQRFVPVGTKAPNLWGLFDCYGNAEEWVAAQLVKNAPTPSREAQRVIMSLNAATFQRGGGYDRRETSFRSAWATPLQVSPSDGAVSHQEVHSSRTDGFRIACTVK